MCDPSQLRLNPALSRWRVRVEGSALKTEDQQMYRRIRLRMTLTLGALAAMLLFQTINWFGPQPETAGVGMYLSVFLSYGILTAMAFWVQSTRWHKNQRGLAVAG